MMEMKYFPDTDTLLINFTQKEIAETRDITEDILIELDSHGHLVSMTIEHAGQSANMEEFLFQRIPAEV